MPALLAQMTLQEKIGQLTMQAADHASTGPPGTRNLIEAVKAARVGSILNLWGRERISVVQRVAVEESRLGIPLIFALDVLHGFRTIFSIPLAETGAFDPNLWTRTALAAADEAIRAGLHMTFSPMLDVSRDPRWGRCCEGPGEDAMVATRFAYAKVQGLQGGAKLKAGGLAAVPTTK